MNNPEEVPHNDVAEKGTNDIVVDYPILIIKDVDGYTTRLMVYLSTAVVQVHQESIETKVEVTKSET